MQGPQYLIVQQIRVKHHIPSARRNACIAPPVDGKMIFGLIAPIIAKDIGQVIRTLLVEGNDAAVETGMQDGQTHARLAIRLHVPHTMAPPVQIVAPQVHLGLATDGNAVNIGAEHLATVNEQTRMAHTIMIIGHLAIVVGPEGKAYPAPCGKLTREGPYGMLLLDLRLSEAKDLIGESAIENAFTVLRNRHEGMGVWRNGVGNERRQLLQRVVHHPSTCVVQFQMKMRTGGVSRIAADGYQVASLHGKLVGREADHEGVVPSGAWNLLLIHIGKALQVTIHTGKPVGMSHIDGIPEAMFVNGDMADITIGNGVDILTFLATCLDIDAPVEMPRARLTEITGEHDVVVNGRAVFTLNIDH